MSISVSGGLIFWTIAEWSARSIIIDGFKRLKLEKLAPDPRAPASALKDALESVYSGKNCDVVRLKNSDAYEVVRLERQEYPKPNLRTVEQVVRIDEQTLRIAFNKLDDKAQPVVDAFNKHLGLLRAAQVSNALVSVLDSMGGTRLRPSGGIYWLPEYKLDEWAAVRAVIEASSVGRAHSLYTLRPPMDADAVRAVRDAIVAEVSAEAVRIHDEVMNDDLGERALENRVLEAQEIRKKILLYEDLLGLGLKQLHEAIDKAEAAGSTAKLLSSASQGVGSGAA